MSPRYKLPDWGDEPSDATCACGSPCCVVFGFGTGAVIVCIATGITAAHCPNRPDLVPCDEPACAGCHRGSG